MNTTDTYVNNGTTKSLADLYDVLTPDRVIHLDCTNKKHALHRVIQVLATTPEVKDIEELTQKIFYREELMSTGIGLGVAVPHVRLDSVEKITMTVGISKEGIGDYGSLDDAPVHLIFMIAAGKDQHKQYLQLLSLVSSRLKDPQVRQSLMEVEDGDAFCDILVGRQNI